MQLHGLECVITQTKWGLGFGVWGLVPKCLLRLGADLASRQLLVIVASLRWSLVVGRWSLVVGRWSLVVVGLFVGRWSLVVGRCWVVCWSLLGCLLVGGRWALVVGRWALFIIRCSLFVVGLVCWSQWRVIS